MQAEDPFVGRIQSIEDLSSGVAVLEGGARVAIPGVLPGERVRAETVHTGVSGVRHGRLLEVLEPSSERVAIPCAHFLDCGGCDLLHASLRAQHAMKRAHVARALDLPIEQVDPVVASPRALGYRALAKLVVGAGRVLGSYRPRTHDVVDMAGCVVHAPEAESIVEAIRSLLRAAAEPVDVRYVLVRASISERRSIVTFVTRSWEAEGLERLVRSLAERDDVAAIAVHVNDSAGDGILGRGPFRVVHEKGPVVERFGETSQKLEPGAFAQVNPLAADVLYGLVSKYAAPSGLAILDLYSGSGGIALALARAGARRIVAVEANPSAIAAARASVGRSSEGARVELIGERVERVFSRVGHEHFDVVIMNPPRKGASRETLAGIASSRPSRLVYVSCHPGTLARDLRILEEDAGLAVARVTPVDLFPQTRHVETIALAVRRDVSPTSGSG